MSSPYVGQTIDVMLGQEFLTWIWFRAETQPMSFKDKEGQSFTLTLEQRIVVQGGEGESLETASVSGLLSQLREAKLGLKTGKKVIKVRVRLEQDDLTWQTTLKAEDFSLGSFRTPKIEHEKTDDPDALFLEKFYLIETCLGLLDSCYALFLDIRLSTDWDDEQLAMESWFNQE